MEKSIRRIIQRANKELGDRQNQISADNRGEREREILTYSEKSCSDGRVLKDISS